MLTLEQKRGVAEACSGDLWESDIDVKIYWHPEAAFNQWKMLVRFIQKEIKKLFTHKYGSSQHKLATEMIIKSHEAIANNDIEALEKIAFELIGDDDG